MSNKKEIPEIVDVMHKILDLNAEVAEMWAGMRNGSRGGYVKAVAVRIRKKLDEVAEKKIELRKEMLKFEKKEK